MTCRCDNPVDGIVPKGAKQRILAWLGFVFCARCKAPFYGDAAPATEGGLPWRWWCHWFGHVWFTWPASEITVCRRCDREAASAKKGGA